jgi:hypothetical protein
MATGQQRHARVPTDAARDRAKCRVRKRGCSVFLRDVINHFTIPSAYASRLLAQGVLGGKIRHQGPRKGWIAVE